MNTLIGMIAVYKLEQIYLTQHIPEIKLYKIASLPGKIQLAPDFLPVAFIKQDSPSQLGQKPINNLLSTTQNIVIGRHPQCQILVDDNLTLVSGFHAEVQPLLSHGFNSTNLNWQICDCSSNGTYINRKQLHGCQILQTGRITLATPFVNPKSTRRRRL